MMTARQLSLLDKQHLCEMMIKLINIIVSICYYNALVVQCRLSVGGRGWSRGSYRPWNGHRGSRGRYWTDYLVPSERFGAIYFCCTGSMRRLLIWLHAFLMKWHWPKRCFLLYCFSLLCAAEGSTERWPSKCCTNTGWVSMTVWSWWIAAHISSSIEQSQTTVITLQMTTFTTGLFTVTTRLFNYGVN